METNQGNNGIYIKPDYSKDPDEDDDDDLDDDFDDDLDEDEGEIESFVEDQEKQKEESKNMQTTPFGQSVNNGGSTWGSTGSNNNIGTGFGTPSPWAQPSQQPAFGTGGGWRPGGGNTWGNTGGGSTWGSGNQGSTWANSGNKKELPREKRFIFCDVLDCLIETLQSGNKPGLLPRGIYDIRLKFEVWDRIACFNPIRVYAMIPKCLILSSNGSESWRILLEYVICSLSEYLRVPYNACQVLIQNTVDQPKEDMIKSILDGPNPVPRDQSVQIGINSGLYGQNNRDRVVSEICGIEYLDLGQLMSLYY